MAAKSRNSTIWTLALVAVIVFLTWKLWPTLKHKLAGAGGSSGGGGGIASPYQYYPQQPNYPSQGSMPRMSLGSGFGNQQSSGGAGYTLSQMLSNWVSGVGAQGQYNAQAMPTDQGINYIDSQGIPYESMQTLDDLPSWSQDDPNAPWNSDSTDDSEDDSGADDDFYQQAYDDWSYEDSVFNGDGDGGSDGVDTWDNNDYGDGGGGY